MKRFYFLTLFTLCLTMVLPSVSDAARIRKVKGKKVYIKQKPNELQKGQVYPILNRKKKQVGSLKVRKIKGKKVYARLIQGKARRGYYVLAESAETSTSSTSMAKKLQVAFAFGQASNALSVKVASSTIDGTGSGTHLKIFGDYPITDSIALRGGVGMLGFNTKKTITTTACDNSSDCKTEISYLNLDGLLVYRIFTGSMAFTIGAGGAVLLPSSKSSNVIKADQISTNFVGLLSLGFQYYFSNISAIAQYELGVFPPSGDVSASFSSIQLGVGYSF